MNRLPISSVIVSAALLALMWFVLTWSDLPPPAPPPVGELPRVAEDPPAAEPVQPASCEAVEDEMRGLVEAARQCRDDSDCAIFDYGYPIQCLTSVARERIPALRRAFRRYHESCEYRVYYDCPTGDMRRQAVCRDRHCEVDLVTIDALRDETLDYLRQ